MLKTSMLRAQKSTRKLLIVLQSAVLVGASLTPLVLVSSASAAPQLLNRNAAITTARPGQATDITFTFRIPTTPAQPVQAIVVEYCDAPLGACTIVNTPTIPAASTVSQSGWAPATAFGTYTRRASTTTPASTNTEVIVTRTASGNVTSVSPTDLTIGFTGLTNNASPNRSFYPRIRTYSDVAATALVWEGAVAQSTSQTLTVNARVQEVLAFCVGATAVDDATTSVGAACANVTGTDVDLGVIDSSAVSVSPVALISSGDNENGVAMVRTNAVNGVVIDYKTIQDTSSGKLKVAGATCTGVTTTDQCFNSQGTTQGAFVAATENFGMNIAGVNCGSTTSYTCVYTAGSSNLKADVQYQGAGTFGSTYSYGTANGFTWDDTGTADRIASSATSSVKVVDDEAMILKFAATSSITTPTGQYTVQADFIATPTF